MSGTIRYAAAAVLVGLALFCAAPVIRAGGYGGWFTAGCLALGWPFLCGVLAGRSVWVVGMLASIALPGSFILHDYVLRSNQIYDAARYPGALIGCAGFNAFLGFFGTGAAYVVTCMVRPRDRPANTKAGPSASCSTPPRKVPADGSG